MAKKKKRPRYKRTREGGIILYNKQIITLAEQKRYINAVRKANRRRDKTMKNLPEKTLEKYKDFGRETDFVNRKQSTTFKNFTNRRDFYTKLRRLEKIGSGEFNRNRAIIYRDNYIRSIRNVYGNKAALKASKIIRLMGLKKFRDAVENEQLEEIGYVYYDPHDEKLQRIMNKLEAIK